MLLLYKCLLLFNFLSNDIVLDIVKSPTEFVPGKHHVVMVRVTNNSNTAVEPELNFKLPKDWAIVSKSSANNIKSKGKKLFICSISVPNKTPYGTYDFDVILTTKQGLQISKTIKAPIKKVHQIRIDILKKPEYLKHEKNYTCTYLLKNEGNINEKISLSSSRGNILDENIRHLPMNSTTQVVVEQAVPQDIIQMQTTINDVIVKLTEIDSMVSKSTSIKVYPNSNKKADLYHKYPLKTKLSYLSFKNGTQTTEVLQYELIGKGYLDKTNLHYLGLNLRGTNKPHYTRYETYNRFSLQYEYLKTEIKLGDVSLNFSRLLEQLRLGKGMVFTKEFDRFRLQTFANKTTFLPEIDHQIGIGIDFIIAKNCVGHAKSIHRYYSYGLKTASTSIGALFKKEDISISAELGMSVRNDSIKFGGVLDFFVKKKGFHISSSVLKTQQDFEGYYNNSTSIHTNTGVLLTRKINASASINYSLLNPKADSIILQVAPFVQNYATGLHYIHSRKQKHSLLFNYLENKDRSEQQKFHFREKVLKYGYKYISRKFNLHFNQHVSKTTNLLADTDRQTGNSIGSSFFTNYVMHSIFKVGCSIDYSYTNRYSQVATQYLFYGLQIAYNDLSKWSLMLNYNNDYPLEELYKADSFLSLNASYKPNSQHEISITTRLNSPLEKVESRNIFTNINYTMDLNVPISKDRNVGSVFGNIQSENPRNRKDIVIQIDGYSTITDKEGNYQFRNLKAGKHFLSIDYSSVSENLISLQKLPLEINIEPKDKIELNFKLVSPSKITGKVNYRKSKQIQDDKFKNKMPQLVIKLEKYNEDGSLPDQENSDVSLTLTDPNKGTFHFNQVKPGKYLLYIVTKHLKKKFEFVKYKKELEITQGSEIDVTFLMKDKTRKMTFKKRKFNLSSKKK